MSVPLPWMYVPFNRKDKWFLFRLARAVIERHVRRTSRFARSGDGQGRLLGGSNS